MNKITAISIVDEAFSKIASDNQNEVIDIISDGYEKLASKNNLLDGITKTVKKKAKNIGKEKSLLGKAGDVLSFKNVEKAKRNMNVLEGAGGASDKLIEALEGVKGKSSKRLNDVYKKNNVMVDRKGNIINTRYSNLSGQEITDTLSRTQQSMKSYGKQKGRTNKQVSDIAKSLTEAKQQTSSSRDGLLGKAENLVKTRTYKKNKQLNENIEGIVAKINSGKTVSKKEINVVNEALSKMKEKNLENVSDPKKLQELKSVNSILAERNKASKNLSAGKAKMRDLKHEIGAYESGGQISNIKKSIDRVDNVNNKINTAKDFAGMISGPTQDLARSKYNKELAKSVGAYGAIGVGAGAGISALKSRSNTLDNSNSQNSQGLGNQSGFNGQQGYNNPPTFRPKSNQASAQAFRPRGNNFR